MYLEMELNHDSGEMDGHILAGTLAGRQLSTLSLGDLLDFVEDIADDEESRTLMMLTLTDVFPVGARTKTVIRITAQRKDRARCRAKKRLRY